MGEVNFTCWVLFAYDNPDEAPILETFDQPPSRRRSPPGSALYRHKVRGGVCVEQNLEWVREVRRG